MNLKDLIILHTKDKINTATRYPSILTLHELGDKGRLTDKITTDISKEVMYASEKIDGTNVRIICYKGQYLIGSRKNILYYSEDLYWDSALGIVDIIKDLKVHIPYTEELTVIYGELFGGKITSKSKNYGTDKHGFRVFDIAKIPLSIFHKPIVEISTWREHLVGSSLHYGQNFLKVDDIGLFGHETVPAIPFELNSLDHQKVLNYMSKVLPQTKVALSDKAQMEPEGLVLRNKDRTKIVKIRFEDYYRLFKIN